MRDEKPASKRYWINQALFDLGDPEKRAAFEAAPEAYFDAYPLDERQRRALLGKNWAALLEQGVLPNLAFKFYMVQGLPPEHFADSVKGVRDG